MNSSRIAAILEAIMTGQLDESQIEIFLIELQKQNLKAEEVAAAAQVMRRHSLKLSKTFPDLLDTCGTGGDAKQTLNASTLAALVSCAAGARVAKHGNRSLSSQCGSADLLEALGVKINLTPAEIETSLEKIGFGFFFAPNFHPATKHAMSARKKIKSKTIFNILGPLSNPANAAYQLLGVYDESLVETLAEVLKILGVKRALVVHGLDGLDEITVCDITRVAELRDGQIKTLYVEPKDFGLKKHRLDDLRCASVEACKDAALEVLQNKKGPKTDFVLVNAAAALFLVGKGQTLPESFEIAKKTLESGAAYAKLEELRSLHAKP